jgi:hypothetical protein
MEMDSSAFNSTLRWGFPGGNRHIRIQFCMRDIQARTILCIKGLRKPTLLYHPCIIELQSICHGCFGLKSISHALLIILPVVCVKICALMPRCFHAALAVICHPSFWQTWKSHIKFNYWVWKRGHELGFTFIQAVNLRSDNLYICHNQGGFFFPSILCM